MSERAAASPLISRVSPRASTTWSAWLAASTAAPKPASEPHTSSGVAAGDLLGPSGSVEPEFLSSTIERAAASRRPAVVGGQHAHRVLGLGEVDVGVLEQPGAELCITWAVKSGGAPPIKGQTMLRVLFVDDELAVLDGMRDLFRRHRHWSRRFELGGEEALRALEREPADVVVTDLRMPGMDGHQLLAQVAERHPDAVRIVLSGYADERLAAHAAQVAHVILHKPCDPADLEDAIALGAARVAAGVDKLPTARVRSPRR